MTDPRNTISEWYYVIAAGIITTILLSGCAGADNVTANVTIAGPAYPYYPGVLHIENGACVPINSTVDISMLGWGISYINYYGFWAQYFSPGNLTPLVSYAMPNTISKLSNYYISPARFGGFKGYWYQGYDNYEPEYSGNLRIFYVNDTCPVPVVTNITVPIEQINTTIPELQPYLPIKRESDVLIARGDTVDIYHPTSPHWWLFGYGDGQEILDQPSVQGGVILNTSAWNIVPGNYDLDIVSPGPNGVMEETYNPAYKPHEFSNATYPAIESPFRAVTPINIRGLNPISNTEPLLQAAIASSFDDNLTLWHLQYQEPYVTIDRLDAAQNPNNDTWLNVRGYTNVVNGTPLTISIDKNSYFYKQNKTWDSVAIAVDPSPGVWREYNTLIPIDYDKMFPGQHYLTVSTPTNGTMTVSFYVYRELAPHYIPPQTVAYIGASPFIPPVYVTVTVTIPVPGPTQIVTIHDTPRPEDLQAARSKADYDVVWSVVDWLIAIAVLIGMVVYVRSLRRRLK